MSTRVSLLGLLCSTAIIGLGPDRPGGPDADMKPQAEVTIDLPGLVQFTVQQMILPQAAAGPFTTVVSLDGVQYTLEFEPYSIRADDFQLLVPNADGTLREISAPAPRTYRGRVQGVANSRVAGSLIDGGLSATISLGGQDVWVIEPLSALATKPVPQPAHVIYRGRDVAPLWSNFCGVDDLDQRPGDAAAGDSGGVAGTGLRIIDLGADADFEFFQKNGSSVSSTMFDIENVINGVEAIYESQVNLTYELTTIIVRDNVADPYTTSSCVSLLNQFAGVWNSTPENSIRRDVAQLFTGKNISGCLGVAVTPSTCNIPNAYSMVESRAPGLPFSGRVALSAHELGHTLNALHCSTPPPGCSPIGDCRIMCACLGGCGGNVSSFGPSAVSAIISYSNAVSCLADLASPINPPFFDDFRVSTLDTDKWSYNNGGILTTTGVNEPSEPFALNLDASGTGLYQDNEIRSNAIRLGGTSGNVLSYFTQHRSVEAGEELVVEYWNNGGLRWVELNRITSDGVDQDTFTFHSHDLPSFANTNEFRIRFRTEVNNFNDDWYIDDVSVSQPPPCVADLNLDGTVGVIDLLGLLSVWGTDPGGPPDFDGDGTVGILDLLTLLAAWGPCA